MQKILLLASLAGLVNLGSTLGVVAQGTSEITTAQWLWIAGAFITAFAKDLQSLLVIPAPKPTTIEVTPSSSAEVDVNVVSRQSTPTNRA